MWALSLFALLAMLWPHPAPAQEREDRYAVVVGVNSYEDPVIGSLHYAVADARAMADRLTQSGDWPADHVRLLVSDADEPANLPTRRNLLEALTTISEIKDADMVLVYFSGHGSREGVEGQEQDYLFPADTLAADPEASALSVDMVARRLEAAGAKRKLIVLDACRNQTRQGTRAVIRPPRLEIPPSPGTYVLLATEPGRFSYEDPRLGMGRFTFALTEGMAGAADGSLGTPPDGQITVDELFKYTSRELRQRGLQSGQMQIPYRRTDASDDWVLVDANGPRMGSVRVEGDLHGVRLRDLRGRSYDPSAPLPAGAYNVEARLPGSADGSVGSVEVLPDQTVTLRCSQRFLTCAVLPSPEERAP